MTSVAIGYFYVVWPNNISSHVCSVEAERYRTLHQILTISNTCFLGPTWVKTPKWHIHWFSHFVLTLPQNSQCLSIVHGVDSPQNCPFPLGDLHPHLIHSSLGPSNSAPSPQQTAYRSVHSFLQAGKLDQQTVLPHNSVCGGRPLSMWCRLII